MSQQELVRTVVKVLEETSIAYFLTGSVASSYQGEPRASHDIDVVVRISGADVERIGDAFDDEDFYLDTETIREALRGGSMFNLIDLKGGEKVDFWLLTDDPFDTSRMNRRQRIELFRVQTYVSSPEDTILAKLKWAKISGGSEKQFTDALRVFEVQGDRLNTTYLDEWAAKMDLTDLLKRIVEDATPI